MRAEDEVLPVIVRATVNLPNLPCGRTAIALPDDPYVALCIRSGMVVIEGPAFATTDEQAVG